jgi:serine/threonine-protein kinase
MLGTPAFMPPEQFTGAPVDGRADLFSLGVILYWMATGEQPFPGETMTSVSYKVVHIEPIPPSKLNPSIPLKLEGIILKCLAKNPDERYQTGEDLARELAELRGVGHTNLQRTAIRNPAAALVQTPAQAVSTHGADLQATMPNVPTAVQTGVSAGPAGSKSTQWQITQIAIGALALIAIAAVGWLALRPKPGATSTQPAASVAQSVTQPVPAAPAQPVTEHRQPASASQQPPATAPKLAVAAKAATPPADAVAARSSSKPGDLTPSADSAASSTRVAAVDFSPKSLDANSNAKLKIDLPHVPDTFAFTVEMNGKRYFQWNGSEKKDDYQNLFVPPGIQEFRVMAQTGKVRITSNTVSTEFKAKKRKTLKIELRNQPKSSSGPAVLSPDSQLFVTLK